MWVHTLCCWRCCFRRVVFIFIRAKPQRKPITTRVCFFLRRFISSHNTPFATLLFFTIHFNVMHTFIIAVTIVILIIHIHAIMSCCVFLRCIIVSIPLLMNVLSAHFYSPSCIQTHEKKVAQTILPICVHQNAKTSCCLCAYISMPWHNQHDRNANDC